MAAKRTADRRPCPCGCGERVPADGYCDDVLDAAAGRPDIAVTLAAIKRRIRDGARGGRRLLSSRGWLAGAILATSLASGCAVRSVRYERLADGREVVSSRTTALFTRISGEALSEDIQSENFIAGTRAGSLKSSPDPEALRAISEGAMTAALQWLKAQAGLP